MSDHFNANDDGGGNTGTANAARPASRRRTLLFAIIAALAGFLLANRAEWLWKDTSGTRHDFDVMNTYARITIPSDSGLAGTPAELAALAEQAVREVNDLMSPFGERSDVRRLNDLKADEWMEAHPLTWRVVMEALRWHRLSGGAFDPTIGPVKRLFRFDQGEAAAFPTEEELAEARAKVGADKIRYDREGMRLAWKTDGMRLDLGAIAKGFGADRAAEVLKANGVQNALIDIGGELRALGLKPGNPPTPWQAGIRNPRDDDIIAALPLSDVAVATSGDYEKYFTHAGKRYEHIIDPRSGMPLEERIASVTVVHPSSCMAADALATTLTVLGAEEGEDFLRAQALGLFSGGVQVVMIKVNGDGSLEKIEFAVDDKGGVGVTTEAL